MVLILPMRNGNSDIIDDPFMEIEGSYPTYEEWKRELLTKIDENLIGSYPTYEEWKHKIQLHTLLSLPCSYPTYEEWKLFLLEKLFLRPPCVLILPMRNGNPILVALFPHILICSYPTYEEWKRRMGK